MVAVTLAATAGGRVNWSVPPAPHTGFFLLGWAPDRRSLLPERHSRNLRQL